MLSKRPWLLSSLLSFLRTFPSASMWLWFLCDSCSVTGFRIKKHIFNWQRITLCWGSTQCLKLLSLLHSSSLASACTPHILLLYTGWPHSTLWLGEFYIMCELRDGIAKSRLKLGFLCDKVSGIIPNCWLLSCLRQLIRQSIISTSPSLSCHLKTPVFFLLQLFEHFAPLNLLQ